MKNKYIVSAETRYDAMNDRSYFKAVKTFKHEENARSFYEDPKSLRMYGNLVLEKIDDSGTHMWDDVAERWFQ